MLQASAVHLAVLQRVSLVHRGRAPDPAVKVSVRDWLGLGGDVGQAPL